MFHTGMIHIIFTCVYYGNEFTKDVVSFLMRLSVSFNFLIFLVEATKLVVKLLLGP